MELFYNNGHLTGEGLQAIVGETLDEMQRLEAAEHLSFCDECLVAYTALLTDGTLIAPPEPLREPVLRRLRKKAALVLFNKYTTVAAAAALAVTLWASGVFSAPVQAQQVSSNLNLPTQSQSFSLNRWMNETAAGVSQSLNSFWSNLFTPAETEPTAPKAEKEQTNTPASNSPGPSANSSSSSG